MTTFGSDQQTLFAKARAFVQSDNSKEIDEKLKTLVDYYADQHLVYTAPQEIEDLRRSATKKGMLISFAAFSFNELARLSYRSRKLLFVSFCRSDVQAVPVERPSVGFRPNFCGTQVRKSGGDRESG